MGIIRHKADYLGAVEYIIKNKEWLTDYVTDRFHISRGGWRKADIVDILEAHPEDAQGAAAAWQELVRKYQTEYRAQHPAEERRKAREARAEEALAGAEPEAEQHEETSAGNPFQLPKYRIGDEVYIIPQADLSRPWQSKISKQRCTVCEDGSQQLIYYFGTEENGRWIPEEWLARTKEEVKDILLQRYKERLDKELN